MKTFIYNPEKHFIGKPCKYGHSGYRFISTKACCECAFNNIRTEKRKQYDETYRKNKPNTIHNIAVSMFNHAKHRSIKKELLNFSISVEWIEEKLKLGFCDVTGINFVMDKQKEYRVHPYFPSLDKIDPQKGYSPENTRIVIYIYNLVKNEYTDKTVLDFCNIIANAFCMKH